MLFVTFQKFLPQLFALETLPFFLELGGQGSWDGTRVPLTFKSFSLNSPFFWNLGYWGGAGKLGLINFCCALNGSVHFAPLKGQCQEFLDPPPPSFYMIPIPPGPL